MTKRAPTVQEYCHIADLIQTDNLKEFVLYFSQLGAGHNLNIYDLESLPKKHQLPVMFLACWYSNHIAGYLIEHLCADVVQNFRGNSVLRAALEPKEYRLSLYLVQTILGKMMSAKLKVSRAEINFIDTRILFEPENWVLSYVSRAFDNHNAVLELDRSSQLCGVSVQVKTGACQALSLTATPLPMYQNHKLMYESSAQATRQVTQHLAHAMDCLMQAMQEEHAGSLRMAAAEMIMRFNLLRQHIPEDLTLPGMYLKHGHCFPEHFMRKQVELLRKYVDFCSPRSYGALTQPPEMIMVGQIIGAQRIEPLRSPGFIHRLKAS